jgi:Calcineurin-like phosphoesterase
MRTLVISDLHLGTRGRVDVLTRPEVLAVLLERLDGVDRLVLLGDVLELRHGPARDALAVAEPVMRAIGDALRPDAQVVLVPGNHDHAIAAGWLEARERAGAPGPLGLGERVAAERASWIAERLATWLSPATAEVAYPGLWLRDDVYATHGHYLDAHIVIPTLERLSIGALARMVGAIPDPATADDYEAVLAPLYALSHATAQRADGRRVAIGSRSTAGVWTALAGTGRARRLRGYALALPFRLAVVAVNRAGLGPVRSEIGVSDLRRSGLAAIGEAARRLGLAPAHLLFGHMHRAGPLAGDNPLEWRTPAATQLHNSGNWVYETLFLGGGQQRSNPYWPGSAIALDDDGPPRLERLLADVPERALAPS